MFRRRFWISLILAVPVVLYSHMKLRLRDRVQAVIVSYESGLVRTGPPVQP